MIVTCGTSDFNLFGLCREQCVGYTEGGEFNEEEEVSGMGKNKLDYIRAWQDANTKSIQLRCNLINDADIIAKLNSVGNKNGYIKELIRRDIKASMK